jgi:sugar phosphate isomerase/epimerase
MKVGLCSIIWKARMDIFEVIEVAARVDAEGIEVWGRPPHMPDDDHLSYAAEIRQAMQAHGLSAPQYGAYAYTGKPDFADDISRSLDITEALGAPACRIWAGPEDAEKLTAEQWSLTITDLKSACTQAAERGLLVTLERHNGNATNSLWGCFRVLEEVDSPALRINFQTMRQDSEVIAEEIRALGPHILNSHATNANYTEEGRFPTRLGEGEVDWASLISELKRSGNQGFIEIEFVQRGKQELSLEETESELAADVAFLKSCIAG